MAILTVCRSCGRKLKAPDSRLGQKGRCPECGNAFIVGSIPPLDTPIPSRAPRPQPALPAVDDVPLVELAPEEAPVAAELIPTLPTAGDTPKSKKPLAEIEPAAAVPKRKKKRKKKRQEATLGLYLPRWVSWAIGAGLIVLISLIVAIMAIRNGHADAVAFAAISLAVKVPISLGILVVSMFVSSYLAGGIEFGELHVVIPKAVALIIAVNLVSFMPIGLYSMLFTFPIWLFGCMFLFDLDLWEARFLFSINWIMNTLFNLFLLAAIVSMFQRGGGTMDRPPSLGGDDFDGDMMEQSYEKQQERQQQAIQAVEDLGGHCEIGRDEFRGQVIEVWLNDKPITDADLARLKPFTSLLGLHLSGTPTTDAGLKQIRSLKSLEILDLTNTQVTDAGVSYLKEMPHLKIVSLRGTAVTPAAAESLRKELPHAQIGSGPMPPGQGGSP